MRFPRKKSPAEMDTLAGSVRTQANAIRFKVAGCTPDLFATMVPAIPEERTWVVLTGICRRSAAAIVMAATSSAEAP